MTSPPPSNPHPASLMFFAFLAFVRCNCIRLGGGLWVCMLVPSWGIKKWMRGRQKQKDSFLQSLGSFLRPLLKGLSLIKTVRRAAKSSGVGPSGETSGPVEELSESPRFNCPQVSHRHALYAPSINRVFLALHWDSKSRWVHERRSMPPSKCHEKLSPNGCQRFQRIRLKNFAKDRL